MDGSSVDAPSSAQTNEGRLDSWKEIAAYLKRDVTTVQRWEKREGMPVHRHLHDSIGSVYAYRAELDAWARTRNLRGGRETDNNVIPPLPAVEAPQPVATSSSKRRLFLLPVAAAIVFAAGLTLWLRRTEQFWQNPIANARVQTVTDFAGLEQSAAVSCDGRLVAFLSDRAGPMDVWITQVGSGEFHNLTHGAASGMVNPSIRNLGFSPDGSLVTYWTRRQGGDIGVWAVPALGGEPRPYLQGVAEYDWSHDGSRLVYHTPGPGDPMFVSDNGVQAGSHSIFTAPPGLHSHFLSWSPDAKFIYFVQGTLPDKLDIWRIPPGGGTPERITSHNGQVTYPVLLDRNTLMYLASDADGSGPWLYSMDVEHRIPHRLTSDLERYTSLAATVDGRRVIATLTTPKRTLWRLQIDDAHTPAEATQIPLTTSTGFSPRLGPGFLLYASATGTNESIYKLANETSTELWRGDGAQVIGGPVISPDGQQVAFSIRQRGHPLLYVMQADGANARVIANALDLRGSPAWSPDGRSITSAAIAAAPEKDAVPHLFRVPIDGGAPTLLIREYSTDPAWSPDGRYVIYSGPDIGTTFSVKAASADGAPHPLPTLALTRGARHLAFLPGGHALVMLRGDIQHKDLWLVDLETGAERQLTNLPPGFDIRDFDVSPDGHEVVLGRVQENSNVVLLDLPRR